MAASEKKRERPRAAAAGLAALGVAAVAAVAARLLHRHHHKRQEQGLGAAPTVPSPPRPASPEQRHEPTSPKAIARAAVPAAPTAEQAPEQAPETPPAAAAGGDAGAAAGGQVEAEEAGEGKPAKRPAEEGSKQSEEDQPAAEIAQLPTAVPAGSTAAGPSTATAAQQEQEQEPGDAERLLELNRRLPGAPEVVWAAWGLPPAAEREGLMLRAGSRLLRALSLSTRDDEPEQSDFEACWALAGTLPPVEDRAGLLRLANMAGVRLDDAALEAAPPGQPLGPQAQQRLAELRRRLERAWELRRIMLCAAAIKDPDLRGRAILRLGLGPPRVALAPLALLSKTVLEGMLLDDWEYLQAVGSDAREFVSSGQLDAVLKDALG